MMDFSRSTVTGGAKTSTIEQRNKETGKKQTFIQEINAAANTKSRFHKHPDRDKEKAAFDGEC